jgi:hypothetical protein
LSQTVERIKEAALSKRHRIDCTRYGCGITLIQRTPRNHFLDDRNKVPAAGLISPTALFAIPGSH